MTPHSCPPTATTVDPNGSSAFAGFPHLSASFVYCPNQFLDQCATQYDRGVVRLVGHILHQTLRWLDEDGRPVKQDIAVSFDRIINEAGVSRGAIRQSVDQALQAAFINCVQQPLANRRGQTGRVGEYSLCWDDRFAKDQTEFRGFYAGEGRRSPVPHEFFTQVVPRESLGVIRVVAAVVRHTIGYSNQFGGRRLKAPLSYTMLQRYTRLSSSTLAEALRTATAHGYITPVEPGTFAADRRAQKATSYSLRWITAAKDRTNGSKIEADSPETATVQKSKQEVFRNRSSNSSESAVEMRFKNRSSIKETTKQTMKKQQQQVDGVVDLIKSDSMSQSPVAAAQLVREYHRLRFGVGDCQPQPHELKHASALLATDGVQELTAVLPEVVRLVQQNYKGEDLYFGAAVPYFAPASRKRGEVQQFRARAHQDEQEHHSLELAEVGQRQQRQEQRAVRLSHWLKLSKSERQQFHHLAIDQAASETVQRRLRRLHDLDAPATETLDVMASAEAIAIGE